MASGADEREMISLLKYGRRLGDERKFDEALAVAEELLGALDKGEYSEQLQSEAWGLKGLSLLWLGRQEEALEAADKAVMLDSLSTLARIQRAAALRQMERYEEALCDAEQAIALVPEVARLWVERSNILRGLNRAKEALESYEHALAFNSLDDAAWIHTIRMLSALRRYHDALRACEEGAQVFIERPKQRIGILIEQAQILEQMKRYTEAVALAEQIVEQDTGSAEAWETLGVALASAKRLDEALAANERAAALDPSSVHLANNVSQTLYFLDRQQEALMSYDQTLARFPDDKRTRELRTYVLARLIARGQLPENYSLADTPELDHPTYWRTEAQALDRLREYDHELAACDEGIRRYPAAASLMTLKTTCLIFRFGRFREAFQLFDDPSRLRVCKGVKACFD